MISAPLGSLRQRIVIITDAWRPQINGVVTTLEQIQQALIEQAHVVSLVTPPQRGTLPCPGYNEIRLSLQPGTIIRNALSEGGFDSIHIATEGPLGIAACRYCRRHGMRFSTAAHTRLDEYLSMRLPLVPVRWGRAWMRRFHAADVFMFPSCTDTLGLVMLEAMACGVPVAAYPVSGPLDVVRDGVTGALDEHLQAAVFRALACAPEDCREHAESYDLRSLAERFLQGLEWPAANDVLQPAAPMQCIDSESAECIYAGEVYNDIPWPAQTSPTESSTPRVN